MYLGHDRYLTASMSILDRERMVKRDVVCRSAQEHQRLQWRGVGE
jgi:hypothetical protein